MPQRTESRHIPKSTKPFWSHHHEDETHRRIIDRVIRRIDCSRFREQLRPAPFYRPKIGAPASQRGQSAQTLAAEQVNGEGVNRGFGGVQAGSSHGGARATFAATDPLFRHH